MAAKMRKNDACSCPTFIQKEQLERSRRKVASSAGSVEK